MEGELLALFGGAGTGALLGYLSSRVAAELDRRERRSFLLTRLVSDLRRIGREMQPYDPSKALLRDPLRFGSVKSLLDGQTLTYRRTLTRPNDGALISSLEDLHVAMAVYNDMVTLTNLAQSMVELPDTTHRQMYDTTARNHARLIQAADAVQNLLPASQVASA